MNEAMCCKASEPTLKQRIKWQARWKWRRLLRFFDLLPVPPRIFGKCGDCGMWASVPESSRHTMAEETCCCGSTKLVWHEIEKLTIWYKPWTWGKKRVICSMYRNGWCSQSLPRILVGV